MTHKCEPHGVHDITYAKGRTHFKSIICCCGREFEGDNDDPNARAYSALSQLTRHTMKPGQP